MAQPRGIRIIGHYEVIDLIGKGGMGEVYKAVDSQMYGRTVAIKIASEAMTSDRRAMELFQDEVRTAATLRHPNIITIHDRGDYEGRPYFIMEYLEGADLSAAILDPGALDIDRRLEVSLQVAEALDYAHRHGVVHRDIKPANIMFVTRGRSSPVKLLDFGIAKVTSSERTRTTVQPGTVQYMSPEQLRDEPVNALSDLFSFGIVLYELFTGVHPFAGKSVHLVTNRILNDTPAPARSVDPSIPERMDELLTCLLQKDAAERPAGAQAVVDAIRQALRSHRGQVSLARSAVENLDGVTAELVESILRLSRKKESEGDLREALRGYRRAALLDPDSTSLELKIRLLQRQIADSGSPGTAPGEGGDEDQEPAGTEGTFVGLQLEAAEREMEAGELARAASILADTLRKFPDEPRATRLLARLTAIEDEGIAYPTYRAAINQARLALGSGARTEARKALEIAASLWPGDGDVLSLEKELEQAESLQRQTLESSAPEAASPAPVPRVPPAAPVPRPRAKPEAAPPQPANPPVRSVPQRTPPGRAPGLRKNRKLAAAAGIVVFLAICAILASRSGRDTSSEPAVEAKQDDIAPLDVGLPTPVQSADPQPVAAEGAPGSGTNSRDEALRPVPATAAPAKPAKVKPSLTGAKPVPPPPATSAAREPVPAPVNIESPATLADLGPALSAALAKPLGSPRETRERMDLLKDINRRMQGLPQDGQSGELRVRAESALLETEIHYAFDIWEDRYENRDVEGVLKVSSAETREELENTFAERGAIRKKEKDREIEVQIIRWSGAITDPRISVHLKKKETSGSVKKLFAKWRPMTATLVRSGPGEDWRIQAMNFD